MVHMSTSHILTTSTIVVSNSSTMVTTSGRGKGWGLELSVVIATMEAKVRLVKTTSLYMNIARKPTIRPISVGTSLTK